MRINALKYRNEDNLDIVVLVDINIHLGKVFWSLADIEYKTTRQKQYRYFSDTFKGGFEYREIAFENRNEYEQKKYIEFIGEDKAKEAIMAAWELIKPNFDYIGRW